MKLKPVIFQVGDSDNFTGFLHDHPAVCAQGVSVDDVVDKLSRYVKIYFDYMSKTSFEVEASIVEQI